MADTDKMYTSVAAEKKKMQLLKGEFDALDGSKADKATVAAGSYNKVTVNSQGIVTAGENPTTLAGHGIQDAYTKTEVNGLVDTPHQNYVTVQATDQTTAATDVLPASGQAADTIYRVSNWDGSANNGAGAFDVTVYSEYAWDDVSNPNKYVFLAVKTQIGEVFDISVYNNNATYPDLSAALGTNGANVPADIRRGGMSVKFVHSSDNNYIQARCMAQNFTTDVTQWQAVDSEPKEYSKNLMDSTGTKKALIDYEWGTPWAKIPEYKGWNRGTSGNEHFEISNRPYARYKVIPLNGGETIVVNRKVNTGGTTVQIVKSFDFPSDGDTYDFATGMSSFPNITSNKDVTINVPADGKYMIITSVSHDGNAVAFNKFIIDNYDVVKGVYGNFKTTDAVPTENSHNNAESGGIYNAIESKTTYVECTTLTYTAVKDVSIPGFILTAGGSFRIKMTNSNGADAAQLRVNNDDNLKKNLFYNGAQASSINKWTIGETLVVYYDGVQFQSYNVYAKNAFNALNATNVALPDSLHAEFIKEAYIFGSGVDTSKQYQIGAVSRNHNTHGWAISITELPSTVASLVSGLTAEPQNPVFIPEYQNSGISAYLVVNWDAFEDGSNQNANIKLLDRAFDLNYSPVIQEYLRSKGVTDGISAQLVEVTESAAIANEEILNVKGLISFDNNYLDVEHSTFLSSGGITSANMMRDFIKGVRIKVERDEGYDYGILKVNNGSPSNVWYSYYICLYKWPTGEEPTTLNVTNVGAFASATKPSDGIISLHTNGQDPTTPVVAEVDANWSVLTEAFGGGNMFSGVGTGVRYNQNVIFSSYVNLTEVNEDIEDLQEDVEELKDTVDNEIKVCVPSTIYAVVGDTLQLYYRSIFRCVDFSKYAVTVLCDIGDDYPRYFEVTPSASHVGTHPIKFSIKDNNGRVLGEKNVNLVVKAVVQSPQNALNVLCLGASGTIEGQWVSEFKRRLLGTGGTPAGSNLSSMNINFVGRMDVEFGGSSVKLEATGGYKFSSYTSTTTARYRFDVTAQNEPSISVGDVYSNNGHNYTVAEINIDAGHGGYFSCDCDDMSDIPQTSGVLTKVEGSGSASITYSRERLTGNPFVYDGVINMQQYADDYCNPQSAAHGKIDVIYTELFGNGTYPYIDDLSSRMSEMQAFITQVRSVFTSCKFCIGLFWNPDLKGGTGVNYHAAGDFSETYGIKYTNMNLVNTVQKYIDDNNLSDYVYILNWLNEFDEENDFRQTMKKKNVRMPSEPITDGTVMTNCYEPLEVFGVNGIHPSNYGYYQMADSAWRLFISKFCQ